MEIEEVFGKCFYIEEEGVLIYDELIYVVNFVIMDVDMICCFLCVIEFVM